MMIDEMCNGLACANSRCQRLNAQWSTVDQTCRYSLMSALVSDQSSAFCDRTDRSNTPTMYTSVFTDKYTHSTHTRSDTHLFFASSSRGVNIASMSADRTQANQGMGKIPKPIPVHLVLDTSTGKLGKALSRMASRQSGF